MSIAGVIQWVLLSEKSVRLDLSHGDSHNFIPPHLGRALRPPIL